MPMASNGTPSTTQPLPESDEEVMRLLEDELDRAHDEAEVARHEIASKRDRLIDRLFGVVAI